MRKISLLLAFVLTAQFAFAQTKISIDSVSAYMGQKVEVCAKVYGVKAMDKITFINLGAAFPNAQLTVVIFAKDYANFKTPPADLYSDKQICVTGTLAEYKGKPQIVITKPEEITVQ